MSSWTTYTAVPRQSLSLQAFTTHVGDALRATSLYDDLEPVGYHEHGVVSERLPNDVSRSEVRRLFERLPPKTLRVLYLTTVSDTTDGVTIDVYEPTASGRLGEVESRSGELFFEDRDQYDDRYDERAATVRELEDSRMGTYSDTDHVTDLRLEYGARPLFHYS